jgi:hypothetical protein
MIVVDEDGMNIISPFTLTQSEKYADVVCVLLVGNCINSTLLFSSNTPTYDELYGTIITLPDESRQPLEKKPETAPVLEGDR